MSDSERPMDCSLPGSSIHGIFQARILEWGVIAFSDTKDLVQFSSVVQSCPTLSDPMDCSLPGSSIHGLFQARVLEWGVIAFSDIYTSMCKIAGGKLLYSTRSSSWCSVMTEGVGWSGERGSRRKRYVYSYGWFLLLYTRNQHRHLAKLIQLCKV